MTRQYPRRRESDAQAARRVTELNNRRDEYLKGAVPIAESVARAHRPRISAAGRLTS